MTNLFPMFLKLEGRQVLVVGAGKVGEPKIAACSKPARASAWLRSKPARRFANGRASGKIDLELRAFIARRPGRRIPGSRGDATRAP